MLSTPSLKVIITTNPTLTTHFSKYTGHTIKQFMTIPVVLIFQIPKVQAFKVLSTLVTCPFYNSTYVD